MIKDSEFHFDKFSRDYWLNKISTCTPDYFNASFKKNELESSPAIVLPFTDIVDFKKITVGNSTSEFVVFLSIYTLLLQKYFSRTANLIVSPSFEGASESEFVFFKTDFQPTRFLKEQLNSIKEEVQNSLKYGSCSAIYINERLAEHHADLSRLLRYGMSYEKLHISSDFVKANTNFYVEIHTLNDQSYTISIVYAREYYAVDVVTGFLAHFVSLLKNIKQNLSLQLSEINIFSDSEKKLIIEQFNSTAVDYQKGKTVVGTAYVAARNVTEEKLVKIWEEVLGRTHIGIHDNFFALGGYNYKVIQLVSLIQKELKIKVDVKNLLTHLTIESQSVLLKSLAGHSFETIPATAISPDYELSHSQHRMWILSQFEGSSVAYNISGGIEFSGILNQSILEASVRYIINRHESLRTVFKEFPSGDVRQVVLSTSEVSFDIGYVDLSNVINQDSEIETIFASEQKQAFDLSVGSLLRLKLVTLGEEKYILFFTLHHIISDGWSMQVLLKEIVSVYSAFINGSTPSLPSLHIQYKDYSTWQHDLLENDSLKDSALYWKQQFDGTLPVLDLAADYIRPAVKTYNGDFVEFMFSNHITSKLKEVCLAEGSTLFMGLLTVLNALLYRYTGQKDIIIGTPIAGREHSELENQIGLYLNTLALRTAFNGSDSFRILLSKTREVMLGAYKHASYPFDILVEELSLNRDMSRSPLFDVMIILQNHSYINESEILDHVDGLSIKPLVQKKSTSQFDLAFEFIEQGEDLLLRLNYNSDIYEKSTVARMVSHMEQFLSCSLELPDHALSELDYLSALEKYELLSTFNDTAADYPKDKTLTDLFEEQAEKTPDAVAVVFEDTSLTYRELNEQSNQVAHYLRERYGIKGDDLIGIMVERSERMIIGLLGILKSGGAYVPIDPEYPGDRIDYIIEDSRLNLLLVDRVSGHRGIDEFSLCDEETLREMPVYNLNRINSSTDLAYVIYTSGTTGNPKGVLIEHLNVVRLFKTEPCLFDFSPSDVWTMFHSYNFDFSVWEMYGALLFGGRLVLVSRQTAMDGVSYLDLLEREGVTVLNQTPSSFYNLSLADSQRVVSGNYKLRYIIFGGEALSPKKLSHWFTRYPSAELINMYGITETTVHVSYKEIGEKEISKGQSNIGKAIPTLSAYILDQNQNLQPVGVVGEICIGGAGLARGYLNRADLTGEKFVSNPFKSGERMYRTGDLGRWLSDGNIEYLGRLDDQVKIRGFRIELGEIESALRRCSGVTDAVVIARTNEGGEKDLVGYVVSDQELNASELRAELGKILPVYMVPGYFVQLENLPLTSNGKVDKKSLPAPEGLGLSSGVEYVAARNDTEQRLINVWEEILGRTGIGVRDNFFDLGGHSLKAIRLVSLIHKAFEVKLALKDVFTNPVLEGQAMLLTQSVQSSFVRIPQIAISESYVLSSSQHRLWVLSQFEEGNIAYNMPGVYVFEGLLDYKTFSESFSFLIARHEILRTVFKEEQGEVRQVVLPAGGSFFDLHYEDLRGLSDASSRVEEKVNEDFKGGFDLSSGPLLRGRLYQIENDRYVFSYVMHHIISDGTSMGILIGDLLRYYNAGVRGERVSLDPLDIQYKDYAAWQQRELSGDSLLVHRSYWLEQLSGDLPVLDLPAAKMRPLVKTYSGTTLTRRINAEVTQKLKTYVHERGGTLFMGLLSGLNALLYRYTGQQDIIIGSPIAGREHADLSDQIGFYVNTLALRTRFVGESSFEELFTNVKELTLDAYEHQIYPFDELVDGLNLSRDMSRNALFDVMLVLQNTEQGDGVNDFSGISVREYERREKRLNSKFDLTVNVIDLGQELAVHFEFNTDLYDYATIERLGVHYESLLSCSLELPDHALSELDYLSVLEKYELLSTFNDTAADYPKDKTLTDLFEEQAEKTPDAVAVVFEDTSLTYRELNEQSNQVAHYLRERYGIKGDDLIGIMVERSERMIIGLLGILKSGGAYVPIDPEYPGERIAYMISDSKCRTVIDDAELMRLMDSGDMYKTCNPDKIHTSSNLAYVIYTSGSTGKPKGVEIEHKSIIRLVHCPNYITLNTKNTLLSTGSISFDATTFEYWSMLLNGGKLVFCRKEVLLDSVKLKNIIVSKRINIMWFTSGLLNQLVDADIELFETLNTVLAGGDKLSSMHINLLKERYPHLQLINGYGPTESTTFTSTYTINNHILTDVPIGRPISNTYVYILDDNQNLQPVGVVGELCIGGAGLARGYLNRAELTGEKFVSNPFKSGERMYRTGDLGRWLSDGNIEYLGRHDDQVKIRGFRIELGEIESALRRCSGVTDAVVIARSNEGGEKDLVGYVVSDQELKSSELRTELGKILPVYMVPGYFVQLENLPLTSNGKVDKKSLPAPEGHGLSSGVEYVAARNDTEQRLINVWEEILGRTGIGVRDNFFDLGGHSLKATRLVSLIHKAFEVKLTLKDVFTNPVLEGQSVLISIANTSSYSVIPVAPVLPFYPLSSAQKRLYFLQELAPLSVSYNMPIWQYLGKSVDRSKLELTLGSLLQRHESLRTSFEKINGEVFQKIHEKVEFVIHDYSCDALSFEQVVSSCVQPFDLRKSPLLRSSLVDVSGVGYYWLLDIHHIVSDGTSLQVLKDDFVQLYMGNDLPALRLQYKDFSTWQNDFLLSGEMDSQKQFWLSEFSDGIPKLDLISDRIRPSVFTYEGSNYSFNLGKELTAKLHSFALAHRATLQMSLLSVLNILFHKYSGQEDIVIGCGIAGRRHLDLERIVGMFVNMLPIRNNGIGSSSFMDFYIRVISKCVSCYDHQDVQFEDLVDMLHVERDASRNRFFDISLVVQNFSRTRIDTSVVLESGNYKEEMNSASLLNWNTSSAAKYDMFWFVEEYDEDIFFNIEYYSAIYDKSSIERFASHFKHILEVVLSNPDVLISDISLLSVQERDFILTDFAAGECCSYPSDLTLVDLFEVQVAKAPDVIAVIYEDRKITYKELNERSNQLAHFLINDLGVITEEKIGILLDRSVDTIISILGVLKAGCAYVPMDIEYPEDRLSFMVSDANLRIVISEKKLLELLNRLQWSNSCLESYLCVDTFDIYREKDVLFNPMMNVELWDYIGTRAEDQIAGGGWLSSYTGDSIPAEEMEEYAMNIHSKLMPLLSKHTRVLEIGCSSGLTLKKIAPHVALYYGTDMSAVILDNTRKDVLSAALNNVKLTCIVADRISDIDEKGFDIIIINSVIQHFHGHNYLRDVLNQAISLLNDGGKIFVGDVMDLDKKSDLVLDLETFKLINQDKGYKTKTDFSDDLFVSKSFFKDLMIDDVRIKEVAFSDKIFTIENELTNYRYDVFLTVDKIELDAKIKYSEIERNKGKIKKQYGQGVLIAQPSVNPQVQLQSSNLAYVIYTSGSTGKPKGCMLEHGGVINRIEWMWKAYNYSSADVILQKTTYTFDVSVWELFMPLCWGTKMVLCSKDDIKSPERIAGLISNHRVTCLHFVPSMLTVFIQDLFTDSGNAALLSSLRLVITSGEALPVSSTKSWYRYMNVPIHNLYGPTEASVDVTYYATLPEDIRMPIGRPISNTYVYILDQNQNLQPVGVVGEICIGGAGLARGYLNRADLTGEKFVSNPFKSGERMYRTGDLGRWLSDGNIEYLGRLDDQVKIRGFRIELGEIESALRRCSGVTDAVVIARTNEGGEKDLVGYVVSDQELNASELRAELGKILPVYMVPGYFVQLENLPLTSNGKVDKKSLPAPEGLGLSSGVEYVAARNDTEQRLINVWEEILGRTGIGVRDNFFDLGGHSLKAIRLVSLIHKAFEVKLALKDVFTNPVLEGQAMLLTQSVQSSFVRIPQIAISESYVLSSSQHRLWVLSQFEEGNIAYNMPGVYVFEGLLDYKTFSESFSFLIARHEILRTVFKEEQGEVRQVVLPAGGSFFDLHHEDLRGLSDASSRVEEKVSEDFKGGFDLSSGPLLRGRLYQIENDRYVFSYVMHHIISDGTSMGILIGDLLRYYNAGVRGERVSLDPLDIQYKDYAAWQQRELSGDSLLVHRSYWLEQLSGDLPVLDLPAAKMRPLVKTYSGTTLTRRINAEVTQKLKTYVHERGGTLFMGLLSGLNALLYRYTGQQDIIIGSPIAGREHADLSDQIGFYVNTLALRTRFVGESSFEELFTNVKELTLDAYEHQIYPFDELVDGLNLSRDMSRNALFDVMLVLQNTEQGDGVNDFSGISVREYERREKRLNSKFDLTVNVIDLGQELAVHFEFNTDLYDYATIERLGVHYESLLSCSLELPDHALSELDYLSVLEKYELLSTFNDTAADYPKDKTLTDLFEEQAEKTPDAVAVVFEDTSLTYRELNEQSNQVAHYLRERYGIKGDDLIGIMVERSERMIIGLLGILKSGGAYVPIDPEYPGDRIDYIIEDSRLNLLLVDRVSGHRGIDEFSLCDEETLREMPVYNLNRINSSTDLAYVIYTSGTTGNPKGVLIEHLNVVRLFKTEPCLFDFSPSDVWTMFHSYNFDFSVWEMYGALLFGGRLVLVSRQTAMDGVSYLDLLEREGVTVLNQTPSSFYNLSLADSQRVVSGNYKLRYIIFGGEALSPKKLSHWFTRYPSAELINMYGITETTVHVSYKEIGEKEISKGQSNIGKAIPTLSAYILDQNQNLQPVGVVGEICIGGAGLARGYLNRADLTGEKFVSNPFKSGERMYRTGDLGRWLSDGNIEYLGRLDDQVKIRGFRIELGEIESALRRCSGVTDAVVIARTNEGGEKDLVGYVVSDQELNASELRAELGKILPVYMVPGYFVQLENLPLTSNGKVDKKSLPAPEGLGLSSGVEYVAARNDTEQRLINVWEEILGRTGIGVRDNFFDLGGHSLKAIRLVSLIHKAFEVKLALKDVFTNPVLEGQAMLLTQSVQSSFVRIPQIAISESYVLSSSQHRLWVLSQFEEGNIAYNMPGVYVFEGLLDYKTFSESFSFLIARHEILRTVFKEEQGEVRQVVLPAGGSFFDLHYEDLRGLSDASSRVEEKVNEDFKGGFDLSSGPLLRGRLYQIENDRYVFSYVMHHIISDGTSMGILIGDLLRYYNAGVRGERVSLDPLDIQYKDYAAWQQRELSGDSLLVHRSYWLEQLSGDLPVLDLPAAKMRPLVKTYSGTTLTRRINAEVTQKLKTYVHERGGTLFMGLLSGLNALLYRYTGQQDIIIGSPIAGREHADLSDQIGFYVNTLALRTRFVGESSFEELFTNVKELTLDAYEHQIYPFDELVDGLNLSRDMSRNALFDVMLVLQNTEQGDGVNDFSGISVREYERREKRLNSKFDLTVNVIDLGQELAVHFEFNTDLYDYATIERLGVHYESLLSCSLELPDHALSELDYLSVLEKYELLSTFNDTAADYPKDKTLTDLFEEQAEKTPDAVAVVFEDTSLTYRELNEQSNQVAHYLRERYGIKGDDLIGIMVERSERMIIGLLGILKSGGAYVPIDPEYPGDRIDYIIEDSRLNLLLVDRVSGHRGIDEFSLCDEETLREMPVYNLNRINSSTDLAYVIYTSGTTGNPKGVLIEHLNVVRLFKTEPCLFDFSPSDVWTMFHSYNFDFSVWEMYGALLFGGRLVLVSRQTAMDGVSYLDLLEREGVTVLNQTPSSFYNLSLADSQRVVSGNYKLRYIIFGGEALSPKKLSHWFTRYPSAELINMYGITETTVHVSYKEIGEKEISKGQSNIGKAIPTLSAYILDQNQNLQPVGVVGEICIGGAGLARGYLNRADLTGEKFVSNPFKSGERMYRTGDLGRWLSDGNIEYLGRLDDQVKIRGFRIELGEIESALRRCSGVTDAVVIARTNEGGEKDLVGYVVSDQELNASELRAELGKILPVYMVPGYFVQLENLPLTSNGKVDKKSLPAPEGLGLSSGVEYVAARMDIEVRLVMLWEEILGRTGIGVRDNFFDLGGHSLKAVLMLNKLKTELYIKVDINSFYSNPTIEGIAKKTNIEDQSIIQLSTFNEKNKDLFFFPPMGGVGYLYKPLAMSLQSEFNCYAFNSFGLGGGELKQSLYEEALLFSQLVEKKKGCSDIVLFGYSYGSYLAFEVAKILEKSGFLNYKLVILDSAVSLPTINPDEQLKVFNEFIQEHERLVKDKELIALHRKIVVNNMEMLTKYTLQGVIRKRINCIEASQNKFETHMLNWSTFSSKSAHVEYLDCGHRDMIKEEFFSKIKTVINTIE